MWRLVRYNTQGAEKLEDPCNVDRLLQQAVLYRGDLAEGRGNHADDRKTDPCDDAFHRYPPRGPRDLAPWLTMRAGVETSLPPSDDGGIQARKSDRIGEKASTSSPASSARAE